jgi:hypothetical protein
MEIKVEIPFLKQEWLDKLKSVKHRYWIVSVFIMLAIFDLGSFTLFHSIKEGYSNQEINPLFRLLGYWPMFIIYVVGHALVLYAYLKPWFRSRSAGAQMAIFIVMTCFIHILGGLSNIYGYYNPPEDNSPITNQELVYITAGVIMFMMALVVLIEAAFYVYFDLEDIYSFDKKSEFKVKFRNQRLNLAWDIIEGSWVLTFMIAVMGVMGWIGGRIANLVNDYWDWRMPFMILGIVAAMRTWVNSRVEGRKK